MSLRKISAAAVIAASLALTNVAPASAGVPATSTPTSSGSNGEKALIGLAILGLIALVTSGSKTPASGTVTQSGGNTSGSFTLLKF